LGIAKERTRTSIVDVCRVSPSFYFCAA
jgi:hypothetical protein